MESRQLTREFMTEFLDMYRSHQCLWKVKSKDYTNKSLKEKAYALLVEKWSEVDPDANKDRVLRKIKSFGASFRKELKRVEESRKSGAKNPYKSKLWYFDNLTFLLDKEMPTEVTQKEISSIVDQSEAEFLYKVQEEAGEVHTPAAVEQIAKQDIIIDANDNESAFPDAETTIQYTPVEISHSLFSTIDGANHFSNSLDDQQVVIWEGAIVDQIDSNVTAIYPVDEPISNVIPKVPPKKTNSKKKVPPEKRKKKAPLPALNEPTKLEASPAQVKDRFRRGCECQDESCFRGLDAEKVFKHRHDIAELTKAEHDMYLMGVTMACLANPTTTVRLRQRRRLRAQYVYQGRRVCLDAFLYLENCTHYQLKRIRKHVMTDGVTPRVHGNHGKKPHNTLSLDIYCHAREFLKQYLEQHAGERDVLNTKHAIQLPSDLTRKNLHGAYKDYCNILEPGVKIMGYSTFRHFMKEQFPHVRFFKLEPKGNNHSNQQSTQSKCIMNNEAQQVIPLVVASSESHQHQQSQAFLVTPVPQIVSNANTVNNENHNSFSYTGYVINEQGNIVSTVANVQNHALF